MRRRTDTVQSCPPVCIRQTETRNPQPGKKPKLIDADTGPSNSVAHQMYKDGEEPRVHVDTPDEAEAEATKP